MESVRTQLAAAKLQSGVISNGIGYEIPTKGTTYAFSCVPIANFGISEDTPADLVAIEHVVDPNSKEYVHHFILIASSARCTEAGKPESQKDHWGYTVIPIYAWTNGVPPMVFPDDVGISLGQDNKRSLILETHFHNPDGIAGVIDSSGVRIYFTPPQDPAKRSPHKAGMLS